MITLYIYIQGTKEKEESEKQQGWQDGSVSNDTCQECQIVIPGTHSGKRTQLASSSMLPLPQVLALTH